MSAESFSKRIANRLDFDPASVPVIKIDSDLPPIAKSQLTVRAIEAKFHDFAAMSARKHTPKPTAQESCCTLKRAAVLLPIWHSNQPTVLFTKRAQTLSKHAGQIAFPGGRLDPQDASVVAAALREAHEEVGLEARFVTILGPLPLVQTSTGYAVSPIVALIQPEAKSFLKANACEVDDIFEVPLDYLLNPANHRHHYYRDHGLERQWLSIPYQDSASGKNHFIWGMTARIVRSLYQFMQVP